MFSGLLADGEEIWVNAYYFHFFPHWETPKMYATALINPSTQLPGIGSEEEFCGSIAKFKKHVDPATKKHPTPNKPIFGDPSTLIVNKCSQGRLKQATNICVKEFNQCQEPKQAENGRKKRDVKAQGGSYSRSWNFDKKIVLSLR